MDNRRASFRYPTNRPAKIYLRDGGSFRCAVRNLSVHGACLEVSDVNEVPDIFYVRIQGLNEKTQCQVVWRNGKLVGISF